MIQVLLDFSYIAHRAHHSMGGLSHEDMGTGVLYGFWEQLRSLCFDPRIRSNQVHIFCDSRQSFRKRQFPAYKQSRHENQGPEEMARRHELRRQMDILLDEALPQMGFPVYMQTGLESDDLIAMAASTLSKAGFPAVMVTADGDLYQCITHHVSWFDPARNLWLAPDSFYLKKGCWPREWALVKAMAGCHTDGVPGIPGIGEKTAIAHIAGDLKPNSRKQQTILNNQAVVGRNLNLVRLPHSKTKPFDPRLPHYDITTFLQFCGDYGMSSYTVVGSTRRQQWENFFAGRMGEGQQTARRRGEERPRLKGLL
jgi:hypothetical protein